MIRMLAPAHPQNSGNIAHAIARMAGNVADEFVLEWRDLALNAAETNPFMEDWFALPALLHLRDGSDVWQIEVRNDDGILIGLMHLSIHTGYGRMPVRFIGNWTHYQSFMGTPLVRKGCEIAFWHAATALLDTADWAPNFLSLSGLECDGPVHQGLALAGRNPAVVHRHHRALLQSDMAADAYLELSLRGKKRKELRRLANRLADTGCVEFLILESAEALVTWCADFLALEAKGWKGESGAPLGKARPTRAFFLDMMRGAFEAGRLEFQRLDLDGRAIAMLVNFLTPPGSWSFKIAFDEDLARFSPGVMIELENLPRMLGHPDIDWMDSCAAENHPMIDKLWRERREIVQITLALAGAKRRAVHALCRVAENGSAMIKSIRQPTPHEETNDG